MKRPFHHRTSMLPVLAVGSFCLSLCLQAFGAGGVNPEAAPLPAAGRGSDEVGIDRRRALAPANAPDLQPGMGQWSASWPGALPYKRSGRQGSWRFTTVTTLDAWMRQHLGRPLPSTEEFRSESRRRGTGFFTMVEERGRWWFLDPAGKLFVSTGVNNFRPAMAGSDNESLRHFADESEWARRESARLAEWGFNTAGCWSQVELLRTQGTGLAYTVVRWPGWEANTGPLAAFSIERGIGGRGLGNRKYGNQVAPIFHPDFPAFVEKNAPSLVRYANDRNLLGYFLDNEIPHPELANYLNASANEECHRGAREAAVQWLATRGRTPASQTAADRAEWSGYVFETYCQLIVPALRKYDPNHLVLGPRLHAGSLSSAPVFAAVGKYCDVISVHPYGTLVPDARQFGEWHAWSGRPVLVTEFYAKGNDLRFKNRNGAGILVPNQEFRGLYYQAYAISCLSAPSCVGWHWHFYRDLNPSSGLVNPDVDVSVNKGLVDHEFSSYKDCVELMSQVNQKAYAIASSGLEPARFSLQTLLIFSLLGTAGLLLGWLVLRRPLALLATKLLTPRLRQST